MSDIQDKILKCTNAVQIVNASAGSGKTTVMIQKIFNLLTIDKIDINKMAVVTFTVLASLEMKERLISKINDQLHITADNAEKKFLGSLLDEINTASIDTIDGFCAKLVKKFFYKLSITPNVNIISGISSDYYKSLAFVNSVEEFSQNYEDFNKLTDIFQGKGRSYKNLKDCILNLYNFYCVQIENEKFLQNALNDYFLNINSMQSAKNLTQICSKKYNFIKQKILEYQSWYSAYPKTKARSEYLISLIEKFNPKTDFKTDYDILKEIAAIDFKTYDKFTEDEKPVYEKLKNLQNIIIDDAKAIRALGSLPDIENFSNKTTEYAGIFIEFFKSFAKNYEQLKISNDCLDFIDVERLTIRLLKDEDILTELHQTYSHIFVDEFQDVNPIQNYIIDKLTGKNNLFVVGDLKQSIYGFRQADPKILLNKYNLAMSDLSFGTPFNMSDNYRSGSKILQFINEIFNRIMTVDTSDIDYKNHNQFNPMRQDIPVFVDSVKIMVVNKSKKETVQNSLLPVYSVQEHLNSQNRDESDELFSAQLIAKEILSMVGKEFYDANSKQNRIMQYNDICLLSRSVKEKNIEKILQVFAQLNIPVNYEQSYDIDKSEGIRFILDILKVIGGIAEDYQHITYFTSRLADLSFNDFAQVRAQIRDCSVFEMLNLYAKTKTDEIAQKINAGFKNLENLRKQAQCLNISGLIYFLINNCRLKLDLLKYENGKGEYEQVLQFVRSLTESENNISLTKFLFSIESKLLNNDKTSVITDTNAVTIQNIHSSKGLEYPVVILFNAHKEFVYIKENNTAIFDSDIGVGLEYYDLDERTKKNTIQKFVIKKKQDDLFYKEELRLLYVALTRAKNKLIIIGNTAIDNLKYAYRHSNYFDLILDIFKDKIQNGNSSRIKLENAEIVIFENEKTYQKIVKNKQKMPQKMLKIAQKNMNFSYSNADLFNISIKNNVTALTRELNEDHNILPTKLTLSDNLPILKNEIIDEGIRYHAALQNLNFNENILKIVDETLDKNLLVSAHQIIGQLVKNAKIYKEAKFMMYVPYNEIFKDSRISAKVLVQGIIDLAAEFENEIIIVDYKYSNLTDSALKEKYKNQLSLYALAAAKQFKKPIRNLYIYSIKSHSLIPL